MHVPDGFFDGATSAGGAVVSAGALAVAARRATDELGERLAPLAGLVAAFIFALQMLNFPVVGGASGHLLGGALAAVLVGPWTAMLCVAVVVGVQAVLFADGGLSAYGINVLLIAIVPAAVGWVIFRIVRRLLPSTDPAVVTASGIAAFVSVPVAAAVFSVMYAIGGAVNLSFGAVLAAMIGTHVFIGIGEALITGAVVGAVMATRPDLVYGARDVEPTSRGLVNA
jgi:cobalt/nickel transport system permease protein